MKNVTQFMRWKKLMIKCTTAATVVFSTFLQTPYEIVAKQSLSEEIERSDFQDSSDDSSYLFASEPKESNSGNANTKISTTEALKLYKPVLNDAIYIIENFIEKKTEGFDLSELTYGQRLMGIYYAGIDFGASTMDSFGYSIQDITGDGVPELIFVMNFSDLSDEPDQVVLNVFTLMDNRPDSTPIFSMARSTTRYAGNGYFINEGSSGAYNSSIEKFSLSQTGFSKILYEDYYTERSSGGQVYTYSHLQNGIGDINIPQRLGGLEVYQEQHKRLKSQIEILSVTPLDDISDSGDKDKELQADPFFDSLGLFEHDGLVYQLLKNGTANVEGSNTTSIQELNIPSSVNFNGKTYSVKKIGHNIDYVSHPEIDVNRSRFDGMKNLRAVSIDEGIESIDASSFRNCESLSSIVFPSTLKEIDQFAFYQTSLETVNIPDNVTYLGAYSFSISTLKTVFYPASLDNVGVTCLDSTTDEFGGPFAGCSSLENLFIDEGVTSLPDSVFRDEHWDSISDSFGLKQVKFPSTLKEIGEYAFNGCANIESFIIPRSLKKIKCHNLQGAQEIYYQGSEDEWNRIDIDPSNYLYKIYFNYFYGFTDHPDDPKAYYSPMVDEKFQSNCINLLTNDANYPASLLVSHKDPKFGTKLTSFISNTVFRGIEGWEEQLLKTGSTRDAQKILLGFISESSAEVEAIATIEKTTEVANNVVTALKTFTSGKILENLNDTGILNTIANEINTSQSQSSFMNMILEGDCTKITQYFGTKTDVSSEKILDFFDSFYDSTEYLKLVDKYMKTLGYVGKISSVTSKTLANIKDLIALKEADDYYIECLEYLAANCSYQPVRTAATQLKNSVSNDYSAALFVLFDALQTGTNLGIDALIQEASLKLPPEVQLYKAALDLGITLGNELFGIKEAQEAYDKLRSAVYINKSLGEWVQEKNNAFKNSFNSNITDSIQPNAVDLIQALNLTAVARSNGEKVLQNYLDAYKFFGFPNPLKNNTLFNLSIAVDSTVKANTVHYDLANKGKKYLSLVIACPVDLSVLTADGITALTLLDGELTQGVINSVYYFTSKNPITDDYLKSIAIPEEGNFALNIKANALGAVDYSVLSVDDRGCIRSKSFSNIPINTGDTISLYPISFSNNLTKTDAENHEETIYSPVENSGTAEIEVTSIQTSPSSIQICLDQQIRITPVLYPANASLTDVFWTIEDERIASINDQGVLTPKSAGKTKVIVHAMNGVTKSVPVEVLENSPSQTIEDEGPLGTARWTLYSNGILKISEGEYKYAGSSANPVEWPWAKHAQKIKKIDGSAKFKFSGPMREAFNINAWHVYAPNLPSTNLSIVESIDLSGWNTNDVTTMSRMFADNPHLSSINLSGWNTSRVSNMGSMFSNCPKLRTIDTSVLDLQSAQSISGMFSGCSALQSVDVSGWNTSKILDMSMLFSDCSSLTNIDVSNWNTSNVTNMSSAFYNCSSLTSLDVSGWNTANVQNMSSLFCKCSSLSVLDVSKWNTCSAEQMFSIFGGCAALSSIDLSLWDTSNVTEVTEAFAQCKALASIRYNENARNLLPSLPLAKWYQDNQGPYSIKDLPPLKNGKTALLIKDSLSIEGASISHINASYAFTGKEITPVPIVKLNEVTLHRYTDYLITYSNNTGPGTATITITGIGKYSGTINITFSIVKTNTEAKRVTMHRLYNPNSGEHFYTAAENEKNFLASNGWKYEGTGWIAPESSRTPVYRLYNKNAGDHHYTMNASEKDFLVKSGWTDEGVGWFSDDGKGVPLYRQYNPNAKAGSHNYTPNKKENDFLVQNGWKAEGISWYGLK